VTGVEQYLKEAPVRLKSITIVQGHVLERQMERVQERITQRFVITVVRSSFHETVMVPEIIIIFAAKNAVGILK
jgi:hypothetical protein